MNVAVVGCSHGALDKIYECVEHMRDARGTRVDLLLCCGDFQAIRNEDDLEYLAVPPKYRQMGDFYRYYSGEKEAPVMTIYIGGNHEAPNFHLELFHGGWVAKNIFFLGYAGCVNFGGLRIAGLSGIFKPHDYELGHFECPPYTESTKRSAYHVRSFEVMKLLQLRQPIDVFLSHDWPLGVYRYGDVNQLARRKQFLREEIERDTLGNPACKHLLEALQPRYWFSAHLHVKFAAIVPHQVSGRTTRFLALDKCLPGRDYLQVVEFPTATGPRVLRYDEEWLRIVRSTHPYLPLHPGRVQLPDAFMHAADERAALPVTLVLDVPLNFTQTVPVFVPERPRPPSHPGLVVNPQTIAFLSALGLNDSIAEAFRGSTMQGQHQEVSNPEEIDLGDVGPGEKQAAAARNPEEIDLG